MDRHTPREARDERIKRHAEDILENTLRRRFWTAAVRDALAERIEQIIDEETRGRIRLA